MSTEEEIGLRLFSDLSRKLSEAISQIVVAYGQYVRGGKTQGGLDTLADRIIEAERLTRGVKRP